MTNIHMAPICQPGSREDIQAKFATYRQSHPDCQIAPSGELFVLVIPRQTNGDGQVTDISTARKKRTEKGKRTPDPSRFPKHSAEKFSSGKSLPWIVRGVLPKAELCVIYGASGSGKTFLALNLGAAVSRGVEWYGARKVHKGRVVYVCAESAGGFKARLRAYSKGHDVPMSELPEVIGSAPNLLEREDAEDLAASIGENVDVAIIDTMSAVTPGGDENGGKDVGKLLGHCKLIHKTTGALIVLVAHSGKDRERGIRGWSGTRAATDAEIEVVRPNPSANYRTATVTKMRDGEDGAVLLSYELQAIDLGVDAEGELESSCMVVPVDRPVDARATKEPRGEYQKYCHKALQELDIGIALPTRDEVLARAFSLADCGDDKDEVRAVKKSLAQGLRKMVADELVFKHPGERRSLRRVVENPDRDMFDKPPTE